MLTTTQSLTTNGQYISEIQVENLSTICFVKRCGEWCKWGGGYYWWLNMADWRVGMHSGCAWQVYFWPMEVKFGPRGSQVMKKRIFLSDFWVKNSLWRFGPVLKNFPDNDFVLNRFLDNFQKRFQRCMTCKRYIFLHLGVLPTYFTMCPPLFLLPYGKIKIAMVFCRVSLCWAGGNSNIFPPYN